MNRLTDAKQSRALTIAVIIAIVFGAYFLRHFFSAVVFAAITAYLFNPIYNRLRRRFKKSSSASLTFLIALLIMLVPVIFIVVLTIIQINHFIDAINNTSPVDLSNLGQTILDSINNILSGIPGVQPITAADLSEAVHKAATAVANGLFNIIVSSIGSIGSAITAIIIYIYVFLNLLTHKDGLVNMIKKLNPLGPKLTDVYLEKMGQMTGAMVRGQFVIAVCQGFVEAVILQIAGLHGIFFFMFLLLTVLSIIPLGGGIVAIPIGIGMILVGDIWQGLFVLVGHFVVITNIDNVLRPKLVPKRVRLNPALTLLAVFSGIAMFGFLGIVIGPVIMIMIKVTIDAYLEAISKQKTATSVNAG